MKVKACEREECGVEFESSDSRRRYCSRSCAAMVNNVLFPKRKRTREPRHPRKLAVDRWLDGEYDGTTKVGLSEPIRVWLIEKADFKCQDGRSGCNGWGMVNPRSGKTCLNVDHVDGNPYNNKIENLLVICPNCHSMTETYGALNKGNGRVGRHGAVT